MLIIVMTVFVTIMMQGDTVELFKGVGDFAHWGRKARVERYTLGFGCADVYTLAFLNISEIWSFNAVTLMGDDRWFRMA